MIYEIIAVMAAEEKKKEGKSLDVTLVQFYYDMLVFELEAKIKESSGVSVDLNHAGNQVCFKVNGVEVRVENCYDDSNHSESFDRAVYDQMAYYKKALEKIKEEIPAKPKLAIIHSIKDILDETLK